MPMREHCAGLCCACMCCIAEDTIGVKTLVYQNQLLLLKTIHRYRCDVIVRDHPTDLGLCYGDVTFQLLQKASFKVPYILAYKSLSRISRPLKIESICGPKSLTRV